MGDIFGKSKIKTFNLSDLVGRRFKVDRFVDNREAVELIMAFDLDSGDNFLLSYKDMPQASEIKDSANEH